MTMTKTFPILLPGYRMEDLLKELRAAGVHTMVVCVPWSLLAPREAQAMQNHGMQSLARLAERGGLNAAEAMAVIEGRPYRHMPNAEAHRQLAALVSCRRWDAAKIDGWQPIETAPKDKSRVLVSVPSTNPESAPIIGVAYFDPAAYGGTWWWDGTQLDHYHNQSINEGNSGPPTHWQPLPEPQQPSGS